MTQIRSPTPPPGRPPHATAAHGEREKRNGQHNANWPDWYAAYMAAEHSGFSIKSYAEPGRPPRALSQVR